jgi:hypothetical protein
MSKLYVFGDSYSTPGFCVEPKDSWWGLLSQDLGSRISRVENYSWGGNNIDSIGHIMMNLTEKFAPTDYVAVGIPPLQRLTMFNPESSKMQKYVIYDAELTEQDRRDVLCHTGLSQYTIHQMDKQFIQLWNPSWIEAQVLRQMITLNDYLKQYVNNIIWVNASVPFQPPTNWPVLKTLQHLVGSRPNFLLSDTYYSVNLNRNRPEDFETHGWMGHHGAVGNNTWYTESIKPLLTTLGWI